MGDPPLLPGISPPDPLRRVPPAEPHPLVAELARAAPTELRCGPSSWAYPGWGRRVWARELPDSELSRYGLPAVAAFPLFRAIGVDRTFHAPVSHQQYADWAAAAPNAHFVVKASSALTQPVVEGGQPDAFLDAELALRTVVEPAVSGLGGCLGHILLQFAAGATRDAGGPARFVDRLVEFVGAMPVAARIAVELRDPELVSCRTRDRLGEVGAAPCLNVQPGMPPLAFQYGALARSDAPLLVRWMTRPGMSYRTAREQFAPFNHLRGADPVRRRALAQMAVRHLGLGQPVTVTVANRAEGCIPVSVVGLVETVVGLRRRSAD